MPECAHVYRVVFTYCSDMNSINIFKRMCKAFNQLLNFQFNYFFHCFKQK